jgi:DNA-binding winged helix-turn-helix (wHTH) protein
MAAEFFEFGPYTLDAGKRELRREGHPLALTPKAFDVLHLLVLHADRVVRKDELMKHVWPDTFVGEDTLTQNIAAIRRVLNDSPDHPAYIGTVVRHGYRFVAEIGHPAQSPDSVAADQPPAMVPLAQLSAATVPLKAKATLTAWFGARTVWIAAACMLAVLGLLIPALVSARRSRGEPLIRFSVSTPRPETTVRAGAASPDGTKVAFIAANAEGDTCLWLRSLDAVQAYEVPGTRGAAEPFWLRNSEGVGFFADGMLKAFDVRSRTLRTIAAIPGALPVGATANDRGIVVFAPGRSSLLSVSISGGPISAATELDRGAQEVQHVWPHFLPDGRHYLYGVRSVDSAANGVYVGSLDSRLKRRVVAGATAAVYASGHLVFVRDRVLLASPFDLQKLETTGVPQPLATNVSPEGFSASGALLTYQERCETKQLVWHERSGARIATLDTPTELSRLALSRDERQLAAADASSPTAGLWLVDLERQAASRFTVNGNNPIWSPDGDSVVFSSPQKAGVLDMYLKSALGSEDRERLIFRKGRPVWPQDWSADGRTIVYAETGENTRFDLWYLNVATGEAAPYLATLANETGAQLSPDGRWLAYASDESGRWEVYVQAFPSPGRKWTVSTRGGTEPRWRDDGKELYYLGRDHGLMAVTIRQADQRALEISVPQKLFPTEAGCYDSAFSPSYVVASHGRRFLSLSSDRGDGHPLTAVVNWTSALPSMSAIGGERQLPYQTSLSALLRSYSY